MKQWNPDLSDAFTFKMYSSDKCKSWSLTVGAEENEKLILNYKDVCLKQNKLLIQKSLPHMIPIGKWNDLWLKMIKGEIQLGYEKKFYPIFGWKTGQSDFIFEPTFMSYGTLNGHVLGIYFGDEQCHMENVSTILVSKIYSVQIWQESSYNLCFYLRGTGLAIIPLMQFPG